MDLLIDKIFPFGLDNLLLCQKDIEEKGLRIIGKIESKYIYQGSDKLKKLFNLIELECSGRRLWGLFGSDDLQNWLPIQLASISADKKDIRSEIKADLKK